jgi:Uma2 family endonuclease
MATPVQPDFLFTAVDRSEIVQEERIEGAPDWVVEVLSPSNWLVDRHTKFDVYARSGVREYWIVDVDARTIEVFVLQGQ